jgi:hypothetical protein
MKFDLKIIIKGILIALCICFGTLLAVGFIDGNRWTRRTGL